MYNSYQIANFFIKSSQDEGEELTPMKLIKLCYIAHGWYLGFFSKPLLSEQVFAWKYGPVIDTLYDEFKSYGDGQITQLYTPDMVNPIYPMPPGDIEKFLGSIWKGYGKFNGIKLSAMTHQPGTPWYRVWVDENGKEKRHAMIPNSYIEEHYKDKIASIQHKIDAKSNPVREPEVNE